MLMRWQKVVLAIALAAIPAMVFAGDEAIAPAATERSAKTVTDQKLAKPAAVPCDLAQLSCRRQVQQALHGLGHFDGTIDGIFGAATFAAVRSFQTSLGQPASGILTPDQLERLASTAGRQERVKRITPRRARRKSTVRRRSRPKKKTKKSYKAKAKAKAKAKPRPRRRQAASGRCGEGGDFVCGVQKAATSGARS